MEEVNDTQTTATGLLQTQTAEEMLHFVGTEAVSSVAPNTLVGPYEAVFDTNTKMFVYKSAQAPSLYYYASCSDDRLYNDREKGTIRQDTLFTDGRSVYGYDAESGGLGKLYDIGEDVVDIAAASTYKEVYKLTEYAAAKRTDEEGRMYDTARATKYNDEILDNFFGEAAETADQKLKDYVRCMSNETPATSYMRRLKYPSRHDTDLWILAKRALHSYFVHYVTGRWLQQCGIENTYMELAMNDIADVYAKFSYRTAPKRDTMAESTEKVKGTGGRAAQTFTAEAGEESQTHARTKGSYAVYNDTRLQATRRYKGTEAHAYEEPTNNTKKIKG